MESCTSGLRGLVCVGLLGVFASSGTVVAEPAVVEAEAVEAEDGVASAVFADTVWLDDGRVKLGVSPSVGRITWFGWSEGENLLWVNPETVDTPPDGDPLAWVNYGGDKVWHSPQPLWPHFFSHGERWPPDGEVDGEAWTVVSHDSARRRLVIQSPRSDVAGVWITREISLDAVMGVRIRNEIERVTASPLPIQAWSVSQVVRPDQVKMEAYGHPRRDDGGWLLLDDGERFEGELERRVASVVWTPGDGENFKKMGTTGQWIAARYGDTAWIQTHRSDPSGVYPENTNVQFYVADGYVELELLSEVESLSVGKTLVHEVRWMLGETDDELWEQADMLLTTSRHRGSRELFMKPVFLDAPSPNTSEQAED